MIDGTFRITPYPFIQLLVISAFDSQSSMNIPGAYILLNSKKEDSYINAIQQFTNLLRKYQKNQQIEERKFCLNVKTVVCDLEKGLMNAVRKIFPNALLKSDKFHFLKKKYMKGISI